MVFLLMIWGQEKHYKLLHYQIHQKQKRPSLVVCPSSLIYNWEDEVHKFSKQLSVTCITGNGALRKELIKEIKQGLYVTSYDYMRRDFELYQDIEFEYVILDEAQ